MRSPLVLALLAGCASEAPPVQVVERERVVYVETPATERRELLAALEAEQPGDPIPESPLLVAAARHEAEHREELEAARAEEPIEPRVVYAPTPAAAVVIRRDLPPSQRAHDKWWYQRAADRCEARRTEWARDRCLREVARR